MGRTVAKLCASFAIALLALVMLPLQALAATYADPYEVFIDGVALSDSVPEGVSYDAATGTLTLTDFTGKSIYVQDYGNQPCQLTIELNGTNTINYDGGKTNPWGANDVAGILNAFSGANLYITSASGGSLTINRSYGNDNTTLVGIWSGGNIRILGSAQVTINITSSSPDAVRPTGINSTDGMLRVMDASSLAINMDVESAIRCIGISLGYGTPYNYVSVNTTGSFSIDCSNVSDCTTYGISINHASPSDALFLQYIPSATIKAHFVAHDAAYGYDASSPSARNNPDIDGYYRTDVCGEHTYIRKQAWSRLAGANRYATMAMISQVGFPTSSNNWAILATGENFPDALVASALAGNKACPVLLTSKDTLSFETAGEIERLGITDVYIMGGTGAVTSDVESQLAMVGVTSIHRVDGANRQETSLKAFEEIGGGFDTVVIATGQNFADALSIGPYCYAYTAPIMLTGSDKRLSAAQVSAIKANSNIKNIVVVGGNAAVDYNGVQEQLGTVYEYTQLAGENRYETSYRIAQWEHDDLSMHGKNLTVATGANFPDALAGAALAGRTGSVMLLVGPGANDLYAVDNYLVDQATASGLVDYGFILGGTSAVSQSTEEYLRAFTAAG